MKRIFVIEGIKGAKITRPDGAYFEKVVIGRYTVQATFLPSGDYVFHIFRGDSLKAIITPEEWYISKLDGECQNLLNRLLKIYG